MVSLTYVWWRLMCDFYRRTGIITNVTPSAVTVLVHKVVGNRYIAKRVNLRVEHVRPFQCFSVCTSQNITKTLFVFQVHHSKCRQEFLDRVAENSRKHREAKEMGGTLLPFFLSWVLNIFVALERVTLKRVPELPRDARVVSTKDNAPITIVPVPYETTI